jgi:anti-repressor protein
MPNSESRLFQFNTSPVRTIMIDGEPWFVAKDVCHVLKHTNTAVALRGLEEFEKGISKVYTLGGEQSVTGSEKGTY